MAVDEKKCEKGLGLVRGMKVLYIAKRGPNNIAAKTHLSVIRQFMERTMLSKLIF